MASMKQEIREHLVNQLIPFWKSLRDDTRGGYISYVGFDLTRDPEGERGCILNSRILWFWANAAMTLNDPSLLDEADHAYDMLLRMIDPENGGLYWSLHADGTVFDATKHTYNQAFAIYALSAYAKASGKPAPLEKAMALYRLIEKHCRDEGGYLEAQTADWQPMSNEKLSENGVMASRTMNTLLHVMEGYTGLYEASGDEAVKASLYAIMDTLEHKIWNPTKRRQEVFFDADWHTLIDLHSFGHDIETAWLADHTLEVLNDEALTARIRPLLLALADETYRLAYTPDNGFATEMENGHVDPIRVWWVQAEALVGFLNAWQKTGEARYLAAAETQWAYIKARMIDPRCGEWFWSVTESGEPTGRTMVDPWKCPYHNGRMCFEVIRRLDD